MAGQIVVAVESSDRSSIEAILGATTWVELRKDRWIATYKTATEDDARQRVAELRRKQYSAVSGPPDEQRAVAWNKWNSPIAINESIDVCFPWAFSDAEIVIEIDPGAGFGRGDHPSTRLLLDQLTARISGSESVLDVGCGSGILAITAVQLGAKSALGIDVNAEGLVAAAANARRNRVAERTSFSNTDIGRLDAKFDVVLANIHYETLCELANELVNCLAPEGWLGLSGISRAQISRLSARFPAINFGDAYYLEDWNALIGSFKIE
ncbi:MAG: hypothetical protein CBD32_04145 [Actinobacteria bacterium TMED172]|nr:MAG: hypothetical protein CBD32_04145 [Actinobacteria bacterium TMED172]|tara:strand:+ start:37 stop:837 length:801 start_codon:yes stop_codon:yes gene_type:complete